MPSELHQEQLAKVARQREQLRRFGLFLLLAGLLFLVASWASGGGIFLVLFATLAGVLVTVGAGGLLAGSRVPLLRTLGWLLMLAPLINFVLRAIIKIILPDSPETP